MTQKNKNPWKPEDEREHFSSIMEWWCGEAFFKSIEDGKSWSLKVDFVEWVTKSKTVGSNFSISLFDMDDHKNFRYYSKNDFAKLESVKDDFYIKYGESFVKGSYPKYDFHIRDLKNNIDLNFRCHSESLPHWVANDATNGWLPMGLGFYRYGFIPKNHISGTMKIDDKIFIIDGKGYFEHAWGNLTYGLSFSNLSVFKKSISTYSKLIGWWIHNHEIKIPKSIRFSTENNPFGYDWAWALLDNGWMIFYGNVMFWIAEGPIAGTLIFSKDGKTYTEFCNVNFRYNKTIFVDGYDFCYPSELEITAAKGMEKLHLQFKMIEESIMEHITRFTKGNIFLGYSLFEAPGIVEGYYFDGKEKIKLHGLCKMEPQRAISRIGHNSLKLDVIMPPEGVGISFDLDSHLISKKIFTKIQLTPRPKIKFDINSININNLKKTKRCRYTYLI